MVMATDADINIEHRLTEVEARAQSTGHAWIISRFGDCCLAAAVPFD